MTLWWLSFADARLPKGEQFLGVSILPAGSFEAAVLSAWVTGCSAGGECVGHPLTDDYNVPETHRWRVLSRAEVGEIEQLNGYEGEGARLDSIPGWQAD